LQVQLIILDFSSATFDTKVMKISNRLTLLRVFFAPVFFILYFIPVWTGKFESASVYVLIPMLCLLEFTDFLDGFFARKNGEVSDLGKLLDPFADVMLHLTTFCCFMMTGQDAVHSGGYLPPVFFLLIMYREFGMTFIRMIAAKKGVAIAARKGGKTKTVLYVVTEFFCMAVESAVRLNLEITDILPVLHVILTVLFCICVIASYVSFFDYLVHFKSVFSESPAGKE
jgi:CDP-diacylglycerol---glycerol-3-phosphate 3-phosphatidyltransferase